MSYEWDFGDGSATSDAPNPTHTYAEARTYTATLTVTYADGTTDSKDVEFEVIAAVDNDAPTTTATTDPAQPNGTKPVTVTLARRRRDGQRRRPDRVPRQRRQLAGVHRPVHALRARHVHGRLPVRGPREQRGAVKTLQFTITVLINCSPDLNDEFDGAALSDAWTVAGNRRDNTAIAVAGGELALKFRSGDLIGNTASAKNVLLKDAPDEQWMVTTRMRVTELTDEGQQAGLVLWQGENPNTFAKIVYINKGTTRRFEYVATRDGAQDIQAGPTFSASAREAYLRVRTNGNGTYIAEGSLDGDEWLPIAAPISGLGDPETLKIGIKASDGSDSENAARFMYFRVDCSDRVAPETTASVSPGEPDGQLGWYKTAPTVTLAADDGPFGGIGKIEYRIDDGPTQTYSGPFTLGGRRARGRVLRHRRRRRGERRAGADARPARRCGRARGRCPRWPGRRAPPARSR